MPNSMSTSEPGPSGTAKPAMPTTSYWEDESDLLPAPKNQSPPRPPPPVKKEEMMQFYKPLRLQLPIVKMMTKKKFPLLMCSGDDMYNPLLLESIQFHHQDTEDIFVVPPHIKLNVTYDSYHRKTVRWMVDVERKNSINDQSQFTAGILADVLNEDKRLEMISCIVANTSPTIIYRQKVLLDGRTEELKSDYPIPLHSKCIMSKINKTFNYGPKIFNTLIKDRSQNIIQRLSNRLYLSKRNVGSEDNLACYCNNIRSKSSVLICKMCGEAQHKKCVVYDPKTEGGLPYLCSSCWTFNDPIQCRATLIIVPDNCLELWNQDIKRIVSPALKCFVYNGLQSCNFMQPTIFNNFDVVLISYSKIAKELNYGQHYVDENQVTTGLRCYKKYPQSPLLCINWWRICLDQPQSYNNNIDKVLTIVLPLRSGHKWILPGTLIQDSSKNFLSIVKYLDLLGDKFDGINFIEAAKEKTEDFIIWISKFVWFNSIKNINSELNLPTPIHEIHWLSFPEIEKYFYKNTERLYTSYIKDKKNSALMNKLMDVDRDTKMDIVGSILILLETCVVPLVHGKSELNINGTFGLKSSLNERVDKCFAECNRLLRLCFNSLKTVAELHTFITETKSNFDHYALKLMSLINFRKLISFSLGGPEHEILEIVYKFNYLLQTNTSVKLSFPGDVYHFLEKTIRNMESNIFGVHLNNILRDQQRLQKKFLETDNFTKEINSLSQNYWWIEIFECISSPSDFLTDVKTTLDNYRKDCKPDTAIQLRLTSLDDVNFTLTNWLNDIITTRNIILSICKKINKYSNWKNIECNCTKAIFSIRNECIFCQFKHQLHNYKKLLINDNIENLDENIIKNLTESNREQTLSEYEILLRSLILCEKNNSVTDNYIKIAAEHMEILNILSSEFLYIWKLWLSLDNYKNICEQLNNAKLAPTIHDVLAKIKKPRSLTKRKKMNDNFIDPKSVEITNLFNQHMQTLESEIKRYESKFQIRFKTLLYLSDLSKLPNSSALHSCNACDAQMNEHLLLYCGHNVCSKCFFEEVSYFYSIELSCPKCYIYYSMKNMERIKEHHEFEVQLVGSYCIKLESIVSKLKEVIALDKFIKVIIFSSFKTSLDCLSSALSLNSINFMKLDLGCLNSSTVLNTFQNSENMTTILINLNTGLKNLKLNFATRVFFMEPVMDKSFENQIIDQICSKQIKQTYVHHFIIKDSIEEKISKTFTNDDPSLGMDLTLGQLANLIVNETDLQTE